MLVPALLQYPGILSYWWKVSAGIGRYQAVVGVFPVEPRLITVHHAGFSRVQNTR